jgi:hypothetical protein
MILIDHSSKEINLRLLLSVGAVIGALSGSLRAEVASSTESGFLVRGEAFAAATPKAAARAMSAIGAWWNPAHTFSGDSRRLTIDLRAGGCFCERWASGQSVEHGRVVMVMDIDGVRTIRIDGALGPLQELSATGTLTFRISSADGGAKIGMEYRVSGDPSQALDKLAPAVDQVLNEQLARLARYAAGDPERRRNQEASQ